MDADALYPSNRFLASNRPLMIIALAVRSSASVARSTERERPIEEVEVCA